MNPNKQYPEIDWHRIGVAVAICAAILIASTIAFAGNKCDGADKLPAVYQNVATCSEYEDARREYNSKRDNATIPVYTPERHLIDKDNR